MHQQQPRRERETHHNHMGEPCDICGGFTEEELIATCVKCNINREHPYCMRILHMVVPDDWVCESCESELYNNMISPKSGRKEEMSASSAGVVHHDVMHVAGLSRVLDDSRWQAHSRRQKPVETGKVKFIPNEEVIRLTSGFTAPRYQRSTFSSKPGQSNFKAPMPHGTSFGCKVVSPKSPTCLIKGNPSIMTSGTVKPPRYGENIKMQSISKINQRTFPMLKDSKDTKAPLAQNLKQYGSSDHLAVTSPAKELRSSKLHIQKETKTSEAYGKELVWENQPNDVLVPATDVETCSKKMETAIEKEPHTVSSSRHLSPVSSPDGEEQELLDIFASLDLDHSSLPSVDITWRGGFILDAVRPGEFIGGFQARPPCKVCRKADQFFKKMPLILKANWLPRSDLCIELFQYECPDLRDVALYFSPDENIERSTVSHARLIERMENQDSMLRICFDGEGVALLIFTSRTLQLDPRMASFLWGVFIPNDQAKMDGNETMDMEVDMIGGEMVGREDIVVSRGRELPWNTETSSGKEDGEISAGAPGFCEGSTQSATGSTEGMVGTSSTIQRGH